MPNRRDDFSTFLLKVGRRSPLLLYPPPGNGPPVSQEDGATVLPKEYVCPHHPRITSSWHFDVIHVYLLRSSTKAKKRAGIFTLHKGQVVLEVRQSEWKEWLKDRGGALESCLESWVCCEVAPTAVTCLSGSLGPGVWRVNQIITKAREDSPFTT